ncbi:acyl--CoA ligase [Streptomyces sp. NBC_00289]|uniref:class I adenylate-forming enzyme family protein n=1 Tax=Streptomyces sp. NBC_00289 TaxID=2975703 RepID=UPI0032525FDA
MNGTTRGTLARDPLLGAGNVIERLLAHGVPPEDPALTFDTSADSHSEGTHELSLGELDRLVAVRAAWLHGHGIRPRDVIVVCSRRAVDYVLTYFAANRIGAIPAFVNYLLDEETRTAYVRGLGPSLVLVERDQLASWAQHDIGTPSLRALEECADGDPTRTIAPYCHHADDPVAITHSSGTTGMPKAVISTHSSLFAGLRHWLTLPRAQGSERMLSALPMHNSMIAAVLSALCNRSAFLQLSTQDGTSVLEAIEAWQPHGVYGFPKTWVDLLSLNPSPSRLRSVRAWWNTGDSAHEPHIRALVAFGQRQQATAHGRHTVEGSLFIDGFGSSEMGHSQFSITHHQDTDHYNRCIGRPHAFTEVRVLDPEGNPLPDGSVGQLAICSPTLSPGYWNDSAKTYQARSDGFFLTGDLGYRDSGGYYYHVDRVADALDRADGTRIYTTVIEEQILAACPAVLDCSAVVSHADGEYHTEILLRLQPSAYSDIELDYETHILGVLDPSAARTVRQVSVVPPDKIPVGTTGKVRKFTLRA